MKEVWEDRYAKNKTDNYQRSQVSNPRGQSNFSSPRIYSKLCYYISSKEPSIPQQPNSQYNYCPSNTLTPRPILQLTISNNCNQHLRPTENKSSAQEPQSETCYLLQIFSFPRKQPKRSYTRQFSRSFPVLGLTPRRSPAEITMSLSSGRR